MALPVAWSNAPSGLRGVLPSQGRRRRVHTEGGRGGGPAWGWPAERNNGARRGHADSSDRRASTRQAAHDGPGTLALRPAHADFPARPFQQPSSTMVVSAMRLCPGLPQSALGSTRRPPPRSSRWRVHPARPAGGSVPQSATRRWCSATDPCAPAPPAAAGNGSAGSYSVQSVVRASLCFSTSSSSVTKPAGVAGGGAGPACCTSPRRSCP